MADQPTLRIGLAQFCPGGDPTENLALIAGFAAEAEQGGAQLLLCPEGSIVRFLDDVDAPVRAAEPLDGPFVTGLAELSEKHRLTIAAGTFVPGEGDNRSHNTLVVLQNGALVAAYRKLHLYDAFAFVESERIAPGADAPPVLEINGVRVGFATCYDLRFPELFRLLQEDGAQVLALASAWVAGPLKEEHFLTLLKARAIENTCYVVASDQPGRHGIGRSSAFDPLGLPLIDLGTADPTLGFVDVHGQRLAEVRRQLPSIRNRRFRIDRTPHSPEL